MAAFDVFTYSDLNPELGGAVGGEVVFDEEAVNSSIGNILGVSPGEKWWFPDFGAGLRALLYRLVNPETAQMIRTEIVSVINLWDPRLQLVRVVVDDSADEQTYRVQIGWRFRNMSRVSNYSFALKKL
jgi:phage baseplate assembly protein W